jgi:splicing factor 3B subunit 1
LLCDLRSLCLRADAVPPPADDYERELQNIRAERALATGSAAPLVGAPVFDTNLYGGGKKDDYVTSIAASAEDEEAEAESEMRSKLPSFGASRELLESGLVDRDHDPLKKSNRPADREDEYRAKARRNRIISPERADPFAAADAAAGGKAGGVGEQRGYREAMLETQLNREEADIKRAIAKQEEDKAKDEDRRRKQKEEERDAEKKRRRWDDEKRSDEKRSDEKRSDEKRSDDRDRDREPRDRDRERDRERDGRRSDRSGRDDSSVGSTASAAGSTAPGRSEWDEDDKQKKPARGNRWDATPTGVSAAPATPTAAGSLDATPTKKRSRWDETPVALQSLGSDVTPLAVRGALMQTPEHVAQQRWAAEVDERNRALTDADLDELLPKEGYKVLDMPASYVPIRTPARKLQATPSPMIAAGGFAMPEEGVSMPAGFDPEKAAAQGLPLMKREDEIFFGKLLKDEDEENLSPEEAKERKIMKLLLKVKNGTPPMRKQALRQITEKAREFGPGPLFNQILPLLMSPTLEDQVR